MKNFYYGMSYMNVLIIQKSACCKQKFKHLMIKLNKIIMKMKKIR